MFQFGRFPVYTYVFSIHFPDMSPGGLPHSDICGSRLICSSPQLFAACHVLLRLPVPRHSPCALFSLNFMSTANLSRSKCFPRFLEFATVLVCSIVYPDYQSTISVLLFVIAQNTFSCILLYSICFLKSLSYSVFKVHSRDLSSRWLAQVGSNHRPRAYQARALAC